MRDNRKNNNSRNYSSERGDEESSENFSLIKKEQEHRQKWQDNCLRAKNITFRFGQFCGLIYNIALLAVIYDLVQNQREDLALKIFALNVALIAFALLITLFERKVSFRKPFNRTSPDRKSRNNRSRGNRDQSRDRDNSSRR